MLLGLRGLTQGGQSSSPPVKLRVSDKHVEIDNGIGRLTLLKPSGSITGVGYRGIKNILEYKTVEDRRGLDSTNFKVAAENEDQIEVSFTKTLSESRVLRGVSGFYSYAIFEHLEGWPDLNINQARIAFKLHQDKFNYMVISDNKQLFMPTDNDRKAGQILGYKEVVWLQRRGIVLINRVDDKYQYSCDNKDSRVHGWISSNPKVGFWVTTPSDEFRVGGPVKPDLTSHAGPTSLAILFSDHYAGPTLELNYATVSLGRKFSGPFSYTFITLIPTINRVHFGRMLRDRPVTINNIFLRRKRSKYGRLHTNRAAREPLASARVKARLELEFERTRVELELKFYLVERTRAELEHHEIESSSSYCICLSSRARASKIELDELELELEQLKKRYQSCSIRPMPDSARLVCSPIHDKYINNRELLPAKFAYVGLAQPGNVGSWQADSKGYQFWTQANETGHFTINGVRAETYNLYAWVSGVIEDYKHDDNVIIRPGSKIEIGELVYNPPRSGPMLWEIGIPDRTAAEFYVPDPAPGLVNKLFINHTEKYRQYGLWDRYIDLYPTQDLIYTVGVSDYSKDWFFAHVNRIVFDERNVRRTETYTLRLALASASLAELQVWINNPNSHQPHFTTGKIGRDNTIARHGIHGKYWLYEVTLSGYQLVNGNYTIYLKQARTSGLFAGVLYDYIRLEGPGKVNN
ncbi:rhamnogalacturonate lyase family protein [Striga asiatica]|uniref:Rhamnogalacturonate lyase family protein n=1 Tax=Striga asiatica TaxID=4170 RepID=A0A5A7QT32_STRAF|nr:rhamnogalacturonate lyase family protein [Striga asiatica]